MKFDICYVGFYLYDCNDLNLILTRIEKISYIFKFLINIYIINYESKNYE